MLARPIAEGKEKSAARIPCCRHIFRGWQRRHEGECPGRRSRGKSIARTVESAQSITAESAQNKRSWHTDPSVCHDLYPETGHRVSRPPGPSVWNVSAPARIVLQSFFDDSAGDRRRKRV